MLNSLKISLLLIPMAILIVVGTYIYSLWASDKQRVAELPVEGANVLMRDLLAFHKKRGGFPKDLKELEGVVWENKEDRSYSNSKLGITRRHYYYLYSPFGHHRFTLWAIPIGPQREEAATWFLVVTPELHRSWKGGSLGPEDAKRLSLDPSLNELSVLGLIEQPIARSQKD